MFGGEDINLSLISAVRWGSLERATELINSYGLSYSQQWSHGYVLLRDALENKHAAVAKLLLTSGSTVNGNSTEPCETPLHFAARNGDMEIVKMLLDKGANIDAENENGITPLHYAILNKVMDVTELLLRHGADVNARANDGKTPLHVAVAIGCLQIVEHLLNNGAFVNCVCTSGRLEGYAPLHFAVAKGNEEVVMLLLRRGAHVDVKGQNDETPLHIAAKGGYTSIAEGLLNHGASIHSSTMKEIYTPLHIATKRERETVVKLLLQHGAKVDNRDKDGKTVLYLAVETGNISIVEDVLKYCPDVNDQSNRSSLKIALHGYREKGKEIVEVLLKYGFSVSPEDVNDPNLLHDAIAKGYLKIIDDLLKYGADVNNSRFYDGYTPLHTAAEHKQDEVAKLLISYGADINAQNKFQTTPIIYAIRNNDLKIFNLLLRNRANIKDCPELLNIAVGSGSMQIVKALLQHHDVDVKASDEYGSTALHCIGSFDSRLGDAHINIKLEIAKMLLSKGANVDAQTENGETPLHYSVQSGNKEIIIMLMSKGANVDAQTKNGETPLHCSVQRGNKEIIRMLMNKGANVDAQTKNGETPLHRSAQSGNKEITIILMNKGANINAGQKDGITPLHFATREGHEEVVKVLLEYGAKVDSKTKDDITPLHLAADKGYQEIMETILKFGADINSRDKYGQTALHSASQGDCVEVVSALLEYGADINITSRDNSTALDLAKAERLLYDSRANRCVSYVGSQEVIVETLKRHIVKMKTANLYVSEKNLQSVDCSNEMRDFQNKCDEEISSMKSEKFNNLNISFYDILAKGKSSLPVYMKNEEIVQVLKSDDYKTEFPIYASIIEAHFKKGMERKMLLEQANKIFHSLFNSFPELPYDCTEKLFSYLSDEDLMNFNRCLQAS